MTDMNKEDAKAKPEKKLTPSERAAEAEARALKAETALMRLREKTSVTRQFSGFVDFLREQSVVGLAIGLVFGTQVKAVVDQMIKSFINPLTGLLLPGKGNLSQKVWNVQFNGKSASFEWGAFVYALLDFFIVAAVVYYVFKGLRLDKMDKKKDK
jgi:large conductance mechanosensitive channel